MKRYFFLLLMVSAIGLQQGFAQEEDKDAAPPRSGFDKSKLFFGGNFGLGFGNRNTYINVSPQVGYRFNQYLAAGAGVNFNYRGYKFDYGNGYVERERYGYAGMNVFGRVYPIPFVLLQAQPELNYSWGSFKATGENTQKLPGQFVPSLLLGAGGAIPTGGNGSLLLMLQYDVLQNGRSPYGRNIFFTMGYNF